MRNLFFFVVKRERWQIEEKYGMMNGRGTDVMDGKTELQNIFSTSFSFCCCLLNLFQFNIEGKKNERHEANCAMSTFRERYDIKHCART